MTEIKKTKTLRSYFLASLALLLFAHLSAASAQTRKMIKDPSINASQMAEIIDSIAPAIDSIYIFPEVAEKMIKLVRKNLKKGKYKEIKTLSEFTRRLTDDLQSISNDKHLSLHPGSRQIEKIMDDNRSDEERRREFVAERASRNFGFEKLERLDGNVGYLDLREFNDASYAGATAIAAMNYLSNSEALIIDLRKNGGGSPSMIQLISSYFFDERKHLNSFYIRKTGETEQYWTQSQVVGPRMSDIPLYILTSSHTFSAAEEFTYNLKNMKRATIVGETTGGGAHPVEGHYFDISGGLRVDMSLPFGRAINPISGTNWEGVGVEPDITVPADKALETAQMEALKGLLANETDDHKRFPLEWGIAGISARINPVELSADETTRFEGIYGPRKVWFENGAYHYQRSDGPTFELSYMGDNRFMIENLDYFRIQFTDIKNGKANMLNGQYSQGRTDGNERTDSYVKK